MLEFGTEPDWNIEIPFLARIPKDTLKNLPVQGRDGPLVGSGSLSAVRCNWERLGHSGLGNFPCGLQRVCAERQGTGVPDRA
jgi:hypothetical protein